MKLIKIVNIFIKFLKDITRLVLCNTVDSIARKDDQSYPSKTLVIVRLDVIGDYILFRNFLEILKQSDKYRDYKITLIANDIYKNIAETLDLEFIDSFIFITPKKMTRNYIYRYKVLKTLTSNSYDTLLAPTYSREFYVSEQICKNINAKEKIAIIPNLTNMNSWQKKLSLTYYTKLIQTSEKTMFEFERNKVFFEKLLNENLEIKKQSISLVNNYNILLPQLYVVLFIGATNKFRCWSMDNFANLAKYILENTGQEVIICGGPSEKDQSEKLVNLVNSNRLYNFVGKTNLIEFIHVISKSSLVISNESNAPHISIAFNIPTIVLYNGFNFKRFIPYPLEMTDKYFPIYHPTIEENLDKYEFESNQRGYNRMLDINEITIDKVINELKKIKL